MMGVDIDLDAFIISVILGTPAECSKDVRRKG